MAAAGPDASAHDRSAVRELESIAGVPVTVAVPAAAQALPWIVVSAADGLPDPDAAELRAAQRAVQPTCADQVAELPAEAAALVARWLGQDAAAGATVLLAGAESGWDAAAFAAVAACPVLHWTVRLAHSEMAGAVL